MAAAATRDAMGAVTSTLERMVIDVTWSCHEWFYGSAIRAGTCNKPRPAITRRRCRHNMPSSSSSSSGDSSSGEGGGASLRRRAQHAKLAEPVPRAAVDTALPPPPPPPLTATSSRGLPAFPLASASSATSASSDDDWDWAPPLPRRRGHPMAFPEAAPAPAASSCQPRRRATMSLMYPGSRRHHYHPHHLHHDEDALGPAPRQPRRPNVPYSTLQAMLFRCTAARNGCLSSKDCKDKAYPVRRLGRSWSVHNATANRAATL